MEELLAYAILLQEEIIVTEELFLKKLDELFLANPSDETLLALEWETDIRKAVRDTRRCFDYQNLNRDAFGKILMEAVGEYYSACSDIKLFGGKMYSLWESLPGNIQGEEPFWTLSYADDPLSWGEETETRRLYEKMLCYYESWA